MSKEVIEQTIQVVSEEKKEKLIEMAETIPTKSTPCDDKDLLLENQKDPCDSSTSKKCTENCTDMKEDCNKEKDTLLNGDFENSTKLGEQNDINEEKEKNNAAENDKKDDSENKQLMEIDNAEKSIENAEKDISVKMDNENNDNTQVEAKPLENANLKMKNNQENEQLIEIDNVEKSIENVEKDISIKIDNKNEDKAQVVENPLEDANLKQNNGENVKHFTDDEKLNINEDKNTHHSADQPSLEIINLVADYFGPSSIDVEKSDINEDEIKKKIVEDGQDKLKNKEIDNVSNTENHTENDIPMRMEGDNYGSTEVVEKPLENANLKENNKGDNDKMLTDAENTEIIQNKEKKELELGINLIEDTPKLYDNEQKSLYDTDKNAEEEDIIDLRNDSYDDDILNKNKDEHQNEKKPADMVVEKGVDLAEGNDNSEKSVQEKVHNLNKEKSADLNTDDQDLILVSSNDDYEEFKKKRKIKYGNEDKRAVNVDEQEVDLVEDNDNPGQNIHKKRKIN